MNSPQFAVRAAIALQAVSSILNGSDNIEPHCDTIREYINDSLRELTGETLPDEQVFILPDRHEMTRHAMAPYDRFRKTGWNDAQLIAHGFMRKVPATIRCKDLTYGDVVSTSEFGGQVVAYDADSVSIRDMTDNAVYTLARMDTIGGQVARDGRIYTVTS